MKKLLYITLISLAFACDRDYVNGPAVGFYPVAVIEATEDDGIAYQVSLVATGAISKGGVVQIRFNNSDFIETNPPHTNGVFEVNVSATGQATFTVEAVNDDHPNDYVATFRINDTGGDITGIANSEFHFKVTDDDRANLFEEDFESGSLAAWEIEKTGLGNNWSTGNFSGNSYADISNFVSSGATEITESWLISRELVFSGGEVLSFETQTRFNDENETFTAYILSDYTAGTDPSTNIVKELEFERDPHTGAGFGDFTASGEIDLSDVSGRGRLAFYYKANSVNDGSGWSLDNVAISNFHPDNSSGGTSPIIDLPFSSDFEDCTTDFSVPSGFVEVFGTGAKTDRGWGCRQEGVADSRGVRVSSFGGNVGFEDAWLITEARLDFTDLAGGQLSFDVKSEFSGAGKLRVYYSDFYLGGDPSFYPWTEVTSVADQLPAKGSDSYTNVSVSLTGIGGKEAFIAFRFDGATESGSATYTIDNVSVEAQEVGTIPIPFTDDFESCGTVGDFNIPTNWIEAVVVGSKTDRGWGCRAFGRNGTSGPRASAFGGADGTDDAWLISDGKFDLSNVTSATLVFWLESRFSGPGDLEVKWSTNYSGSGDPSSATWTTLGDVAAQYPADGSQVFTEITGDLSGAAGQKIHLAFRYFGGTASSSIALTIDDLSITGN